MRPAAWAAGGTEGTKQAKGAGTSLRNHKRAALVVALLALAGAVMTAVALSS